MYIHVLHGCAHVSGIEKPEDWMRIDRDYHSNFTNGSWETTDAVFKYGVATTDGDGTVPQPDFASQCLSENTTVRVMLPLMSQIWFHILGWG